MNAEIDANPVWHEGERVLQQRAGVAEGLAAFGSRVIRDHMPMQHREFFARLPWLVAGSVDTAGQPWASALTGPAGFVQSPDERSLRIGALPLPADPLRASLLPGRPVGLLGIEPQTRRRNRANGAIGEVDARGFTVQVRQSFGNCPKYIQAREPVLVERTPAPAARRASGMDAAARAIVAKADTFFIATAHPDAGGGLRSHGVDVSHRGGRPGFVRLDGADGLAVPDFMGNSFFNTLGNITLHPLAGLLFIDYESGDLLQIGVRAELLWDGPEVAAFAGAERLLKMRVVSVLHQPGALPLRWGSVERSPFLDGTGRWPEAA